LFSPRSKSCKKELCASISTSIPCTPSCSRRRRNRNNSNNRRPHSHLCDSDNLINSREYKYSSLEDYLKCLFNQWFLFFCRPTQLRYLLAAYNVGMLAMETLARRVHDDRPQAKYARNPPYGEDVKWLLRISKKLGTQYLHQFCICAVNSIVSPFVLHDVAIESAHYLGRNNHQLVMQHLRSALTPLVQKCQQM